MTATTIHNTLKLGSGVFSLPEVAFLLGVPTRKVYRYVTDFMDERAGKKLFQTSYSFTTKSATDNKKQRSVTFHVLVELHAMMQLRDIGLSATRILKAREQMIRDLDTAHPFAWKKLLTDGKTLWYEYMEEVVKADGKQQLAMQKILEPFVQKVDFDANDLAARYWPQGKESSIVVDPHHQFGQPVISKTNVGAQTIYDMHQSGESVHTLSILYDLTKKEVDDAIRFYSKAA
jgi:uncharacterized protein (DUF433 family)